MYKMGAFHFGHFDGDVIAILWYSWQTLVLSAEARIRRAWDRLASRRARMVSGVSIRAAPKRPFNVRVVVNRLAYKFYEGPVTFYGDRAILCFC